MTSRRQVHTSYIPLDVVCIFLSPNSERVSDAAHCCNGTKNEGQDGGMLPPTADVADSVVHNRTQSNCGRCRYLVACAHLHCSRTWLDPVVTPTVLLSGRHFSLLASAPLSLNKVN